MRKYLKSFNVFLFTLVFTISIVLLNTNVISAAPKYKRIFGNNRYETSKEIASSGWVKSDYAVVVSGEGFADALSAAPLARKYNAPIILTEGKNLNGNSKNQLKRLDVKDVIIVGGTGSISSNTEKQIKNLGINTRRIYGNSRFDTSLEVAKEIGIENGIIVTNGLGFADALSIAPIAANKQIPILLTTVNDLPKNIKNFINSNSYNKSYILGGKAVVSDTIENSLKNPKRIYGNSRYDTNAAILNEFEEEVNLDNIYIAAGSNYPDALSSSALAAKSNSPIILVSNKVENSVMKFIKNKHSNFNNINVIGGSVVVNDNTVETIVEGKEVSNLPGDFKIHYIDVGQGDAILVQTSDRNMLIDAGPNTAKDKVISYLRNNEISKLDYVVATHPHEDHIGNMADVINNFEIGQFIAPKVTHTSKTFKNMVSALKSKGLKIKVANNGDRFNLGNVQVDILAPNNSNYENLNNYSVVLKLKFGNRSFIFTGDAESISEGEILQKQLDVKGDVLKVGHHGSSTSSTDRFVQAINPKYAVISVGSNNKYGHPNEVVLNRLSGRNIKIYRTDKQGDIVVTTNGNDINFNTKASDFNDIKLEPMEPLPETYKININTASLEQLQNIKHIGEERAKEIIKLRPFKTINELTKVKGIGKGRLKDIIAQGKAFVK